MGNLSTFKLVLLGIFSVAIVIGVAMFALSKAGPAAGSSNLVVWGTISPDVFNAAYKNSSLASNKQIKILYIKKDESTFDADFVDALAQGIGPDMVVLRDDNLYKNENKLFVIPFASYPQRTFLDTFIPEGQVNLTPDGVVALPFMVDPLVMYWNKDMFTKNFVVQPPQYWDQIYDLVNKMTSKTSGGDILQSAIALGGWQNITNAKEVVSLLLLQAGTPITAAGPLGVTSVLNSQGNYPVAPSTSAINFYTQFSNPTSPAYSWNRSLPLSLTFFLSGKLATYLGFASEISGIQQKNSNLNFDVRLVPQIRDASTKITFGHMYSLAIVKQSKQIAGAFTAIAGLTESAAIGSLEALTGLPPVRLNLLASKPIDAYRVVFYNSALISRSWIDPDSAASTETFRNMIESITSGKSLQGEALQKASDELSLELSKGR